MDIPKNWIKPLARAGYASRGVIYVVVGLFAILAAVGAADKKDTKGAVSEILQQPFGSAMIAALLCGLVGYVVWRLVQSLFDTDEHGWSVKGMAVRAGLLASAATYTALAVYTLSLLGLFSKASGADYHSPVADFFAGLIGIKMVLIGLVVVFAGVAIAHWYKALTRRYADHFDAGDSAMTLIHPVSIIGLLARGAVFAVISILLLYRFFTVRPVDGTPPGIKDAMAFLQQLPFGPWLLGLLGAGLVLFAIYSLMEAVWRRINIEDA